MCNRDNTETTPRSAGCQRDREQRELDLTSPQHRRTPQRPPTAPIVPLLWGGVGLGVQPVVGDDPFHVPQPVLPAVRGTGIMSTVQLRAAMAALPPLIPTSRRHRKGDPVGNQM